MTSRGRLSEAGRTVLDRPALLVAGLAIAVADVASLVLVGVGAGAAFAGGPLGLGLALGGRLLLLAAVAFVLPGVYASVREDANGLRSADGRRSTGGLRSAGGLRSVASAVVAGARRSGTTLLGASLTAHAVALVVAVPLVVLAGALLLGLDTLVQVGVRALGRAGRDPWGGPPGLLVAGLLATTGVAAFLARLPLSFHDVAAVDGDAGPRDAWRVSYGATSARPGATLSYGAGRLGLLAAPGVVAVLTGWSVDAVVDGVFGVGAWQYRTVQVATVGSFLLTSAVARTVLAVYHVRAADEAFLADGAAAAASAADEAEEAASADEAEEVAASETVGVADASEGPASPSGVDAHPTPRLPRPRTVIAVLVVTAVLSGSVLAVRVDDGARSPTADPPAVPAVGEADPATVLAAANERTIATAHREVATVRYYEDGEWKLVYEVATTLDPGDRRARTEILNGTLLQNGTVYVEEGRVAATTHHVGWGLSHEFDRERRRGALRVGTGPPTAVFRERAADYPDPSLPWTVVNRTDETVVYGLSDPAALQRVDGLAGPFPPPTDEEIAYRGNNSVRVTVDRRTGRLVAIRARSSYEQRDPETNETELRRSRTTVRFEDYGAVDVHRPDGLGPRPAYAVLWDVISY